MDYQKLMNRTFKAMLEEGETLRCPFYGTLDQKPRPVFAFFALTDTHLLVATLTEDQRKAAYTSRVPLDVKKVRVKKSLIPSQYSVRIEFNQGEPCKIRLSKKVYGTELPDQEQNVTAFMEELQRRFS